MNVKSLIILSVGLANCTASTDGRYVGHLSVEQGSCSSESANNGQVVSTLVLRDDQAEFAPEDGAVVLTGKINNAGHLLIWSNAPGVDHKPFPQVFEGDRNGNQIVGKFATPFCRATIELSRR